jgi:hypothetical protein
MPVPTFDVWDQATLTDTIVRPAGGRVEGAAEDSPTRLGETIAPKKDIQSRTAKLRIQEIKPFGKGQFRAPDATPPLMTVSAALEDRVIELALLDEMHRIPEEEFMKLSSADENIARSAGVSLVERGTVLQTRNERLQEWMRWQAFQGSLTITYPTGQTIFIDYGLSTGHKPTLGTLWSSTATADPVANLQTWSELIADDTGFYARFAHMNSKTYSYLVSNTKIIQAINFYASGANQIQRPRRQDITALFESFGYAQEVVLYDNGYRDEGATGIGRPSLTKYLPDGKVLVTTDYKLDGVNIADMLDGLVTVSAGYNNVAIRQGFQTEVMLDHLSKTHFLRAASANIVRLNYPDAFVYATVA